MKNWFKRLHLLITNLTKTKWGTLTLFLSALADAAAFPLPVTTFFIILILLNNKLTFKYIVLVVTGTMAGAFLGYSIGRFIWLKPNGDLSGVANFLFNNIPGFSEVIYEKVHALYIKWDFWILIAATTTPLPYGMFSVASGAFNMNIPVFFLASFISQGIKFLFLGILTLKFGPRVRELMELNWKPVAILTACLVLAIIVSNVIKA
jgi:membrane protein YqaA with SNARE-associated domain